MLVRFIQHAEILRKDSGSDLRILFHAQELLPLGGEVAPEDDGFVVIDALDKGERMQDAI